MENIHVYLAAGGVLVFCILVSAYLIRDMIRRGLEDNDDSY